MEKHNSFNYDQDTVKQLISDCKDRIYNSLDSAYTKGFDNEINNSLLIGIKEEITTTRTLEMYLDKGEE